MGRLGRMVVSAALVVVLVTSGGCATFRTLESAGEDGPRVFSGTRLDIHALTGNHAALKKFNVPPLKYPLLDLPFSFVADLVFLLFTVPPAAHDKLFDDQP